MNYTHTAAAALLQFHTSSIGTPITFTEHLDEPDICLNRDRVFGYDEVPRDKWIKAFWQYLDKNSAAGEMIRRWQKAGCDPRKVAISIHRFVIGYSSKLNAPRKERKKRAKRILTAAVRNEDLS